jgi:hypothetical protein
MSDDAEPVAGGCLCGAFRYESSEEPYAVAYCHCNSCKKALGSVLGMAAFFHGEAFRFTKGKPKVRQSSEVAERAFCGEYAGHQFTCGIFTTRTWACRLAA